MSSLSETTTITTTATKHLIKLNHRKFCLHSTVYSLHMIYSYTENLLDAWYCQKEQAWYFFFFFNAIEQS